MKKLIPITVILLAVAACSSVPFVRHLLPADQALLQQEREDALNNALAAGDYAEADRIEQEITATDDAAIAPYVDVAQTVVSDFVPAGPWKPLALGAIALGSRLLTSRGRRHAAKGIRSASRLALLDTAKSVAAALGYTSGSVEDAEQSLEDVKRREELKRIRGKRTQVATEDFVREAVAIAVAEALAHAREQRSVEQLLNDPAPFDEENA